MFILQKYTVLYREIPTDFTRLSDVFYTLQFGDIVTPVTETTPSDNFFYVETIDGTRGWISSKSGICLNCNEDSNLFFFGNSYYQKRYKEAEGKIDDSNKIILLKNVIPLLLGNFSTEGWFYPKSPDLALSLSKLGVSLAKDQNTFFHSATSYDWRVNEIVISNNLLADCYQELKFYRKAYNVHKMLQRRYFWKYSDNTQIGGINSTVKIVIILCEMLAYESPGSSYYETYKEMIIEEILLIGNNFNIWTLADKKWHLTAAEWMLDILQKNLSSEEFYKFADILVEKSESEGYKDMVRIYIALEKYNDGHYNEALELLSSIKPKKNFKVSLNIDDWLSAKRIAPDSLIYQYKF